MAQRTISDAEFRRVYERFRKFELDLEFVQLIGDINYVNYLVFEGYTKKKEFQAYLKYLEYLKQPDFIIFIRYPLGLNYLTLLQSPEFCRMLEMDQLNPERQRLKIVEKNIQQQQREAMLLNSLAVMDDRMEVEPSQLQLEHNQHAIQHQ